MPVSEWEEVLSKLGVALFVGPLIYIGISIVTQLAYVLLVMLLASRMGMEPFDLILDKVEFGSLFHLIDSLFSFRKCLSLILL